MFAELFFTTASNEIIHNSRLRGKRAVLLLVAVATFSNDLESSSAVLLVFDLFLTEPRRWYIAKVDSSVYRLSFTSLYVQFFCI